MQLFIADGKTIQTILKATDTDGESSFREEETPLMIPNTGNTTAISISKGANYLVYKAEDRDDLGIIPGCEHNARFD